MILLAIGALAVVGHGTTAMAAAPIAAPGSASPAEFAGGAGTTRASRASPWRWAATATAWTRSQALLPRSILDPGPTTRISRAQFVRSLLLLEAQRNERYGTDRLLFDQTKGAVLSDVSPSSPAARAVKLGWIAPIGGRFAGTSPITANDAALGMAGVLGLRPSVSSLATRLRTEVPGTRTNFIYASAHALTRTIGLRYNVLDPNDELELGPRQAVNVAHFSWMLYVAGTGLEDWEVDSARELATTFDLPRLGPSQARILATGVRQLGQPYVWGGETEGSQAEGHGGFDCSGFSIRIVNGSGLARTTYRPIGERTTYDMSDIPRARRIVRARLQPGDVLFFGERGPSSSNEQNYHAGVYMGNGWFIHSSGGNAGVAIDRLEGYWGNAFSWGRRVLITT